MMDSRIKVHDIPALLKRYEANRFNIILSDRERGDTANSSILFFRRFTPAHRLERLKHLLTLV